MKVKIGNKVYDSNEEPIMLILNNEDKENINNMHSGMTKFISFPKTANVEEVKAWIKNEK